MKGLHIRSPIQSFEGACCWCRWCRISSCFPLQLNMLSMQLVSNCLRSCAKLRWDMAPGNGGRVLCPRISSFCLADQFGSRLSDPEFYYINWGFNVTDAQIGLEAIDGALAFLGTIRLSNEIFFSFFLAGDEMLGGCTVAIARTVEFHIHVTRICFCQDLKVLQAFLTV